MLLFFRIHFQQYIEWTSCQLAVQVPLLLHASITLCLCERFTSLAIIVMTRTRIARSGECCCFPKKRSQSLSGHWRERRTGGRRTITGEWQWQWQCTLPLLLPLVDWALHSPFIGKTEGILLPLLHFNEPSFFLCLRQSAWLAWIANYWH